MDEHKVDDSGDMRGSEFDLQRSAAGFEAMFFSRGFILRTFVFGTIFVVLAVGLVSIEWRGGIFPEETPWSLSFDKACSAAGDGNWAAAAAELPAAIRESEAYRFGDVRQGLTMALGAVIHAASEGHEEAAQSAERALTLLKYTNSVNSPIDAVAFEFAGKANALGQRWAEAESAFLESLSLREKALDVRDAELLIGVDDLARVYRATSRDDEADRLCQRFPAADSAAESDLANDGHSLKTCAAAIRRIYAATLSTSVGCLRGTAP